MSVIWELDFYSRPVLDDKNKKLWEVLICESPTSVQQSSESLFRYSHFCSNTEVNSVTLRTAIEDAIAQAPNSPDRVRFFRRQMNNMITKACEEAGLSAKPSRRTIALNQWLQQRMQEVYPTYPTYQPGSNISVNLGESPPQPLPDALLGERWAFVTLEAKDFDDMPDWDISFGESFPPALVGLAPETRIPGIIIFSSRALPMAGWMSGVELAFLRLSINPARLVLETGATDSWIVANLTTPALLSEAKTFETAKQQANQVHFLAVQTNPDSEAFAGFWLMQELNLS
ncbi:Tab2/Atab2 family RNA-binding protein [Oculatella sp. LEGE 06141]|uniref:Tab2/Atab2 family RNA-binding protein n=1 Tax=Oculatella sp. LEGE 06141 TaxID=1828648 RepID=UPI001880353A|nr:Tab2/Atab2 family RNA-binding protein [Oculatella sp. LEGE 06141]MBE9181365.1 Tab2/Atab2 family RNA-binding protein [Oculatella sp. LEGE 06141]